MPLFNKSRQTLSRPWLFFGRWLVVVFILFNSLFPQFLGFSLSARSTSLPRAQAASPNLVISQVYGGGGNSGATLRNDFIEIFNRGTSAVYLNGYSVQYGSASSDIFTSTNLTAVSLAPGQYYLIQEANGTNITNTSTLPTPDAIGGINMSATAGKVALVYTTTILSCGGGTACSTDKQASIVDLLGYGTSSTFYEGSPAITASNTTSEVRAGASCTDTDNNNSDFSLSNQITPRNSSTSFHTCNTPINQPIVPNCSGSIVTAQGVAASKVISATDSDGIVSSASVTSVSPSPSPGSITLTSVNPATVSGGTLTATLSVDAAAPPNDYTVTTTFTNTDTPTPQTATCNVTVSVTAPPVITRTYTIQGAGHTSPLVNQVVTTEGVVTAIKGTSGFYIQDATGDGDPNTSDGLFVYSGNPVPSSAVVGHLVRVKGTVSEYRSASRPNDLTLTELSGSLVVTDLGPGPTITPIIISTDPNRTGLNIRKPPAVIDATPGVYNPAANGIDFYESLEGMLVEVDNARVTGPTSTYNDFVIIPDNGVGATGLTPRGGILISPTDFNPERIFVDLGVVGASGIPKVIVGDRIIPPVIGPLDYAYSNFRIQTRSAIGDADLDTTNRVTQQSVAPLTDPNFLRFAIYNIQNFSIYSSDSSSNFVPDPQHVQTIANHIRLNLAAPDLLLLTEVQDSDGKADTGIVTATTSLNALRDQIYTDSSNTISYTYRLIDPVNNQDGGQPGGNIRQVFFFRTDRGLSFVDKPGAGSTTANTVLPDGSLQYSPGRIDPTNSAFNNSRKPLAGEFMFNGQRLIVIGNHLNSKGGDQPLYGTNQPPVLNSEVQRNQQANIIRDFVSQIITATPNANVIVAGDLNDFQFSNPLNILRDKQGALTGNQIFHILVEDPRVANSPYSYVYEGNAQDLDHILYSQGLVNKVITPNIVHINSEFYSSYTGQGSDHEPETIVFGFTPICTQPYVVTSQTDNGAGGCGTLSYAINQANQAAQPLTITFQPGAMTVTVTGKLPDISGAITHTITLSGGCASNVPGVVITGTFGIPVGLSLNDYVTLDGLKLTSFSEGYAVQINGSNNHLTCNWLGTASGTSASPNGGGLRIGLTGGVAANNNTLGVAGTPGAGNIIAGNTGIGLQVENGTNNTLFNTLVGFGSDGSSLKNQGGSVRVLAGGQLKPGSGNRFQ